MALLPHEKQILEYEKTIQKLREQNSEGAVWSQEELGSLEVKLEKAKKRVYADLGPWERVAISRHPKRPHTVDYIKHLCNDFVELFGDRLYRDDRSIIVGLARIQDMKCVVIGQEKGSNTEERLQRNFGMTHPEGYRKAMRGMRLAAKFNLPVVTLIDTPGAYPGLSAEERGQGWAIANNLWEMARLPTPIIVLLIGEGCSGGALGIGVGDVIGMLEHAYYSVISPEGCASILWKDPKKNATAALALKMQSEDLLRMKVIDAIIKEPLGGAHHDPQAVYAAVRTFIFEQWELLKETPIDLLLELRYQKFRSMGSVLYAEDVIP